MTNTQTEATYHGIVRVKCLQCGYESREVTEMELWNDYGVSCIRDCAEGATEFEMSDGSVSIIVQDEDGNVTRFEKV